MKKTIWMKGTADKFSRLPAGTKVRFTTRGKHTPADLRGVVRVRGVPTHCVRRGRGLLLTHFGDGSPWGEWADGYLYEILAGHYEYKKPSRKKRASKATTR